MKMVLVPSFLALAALLPAQDGDKPQDPRDKKIIRPLAEILTEMDGALKTAKSFSVRVNVSYVLLYEPEPVQLIVSAWVLVDPKTQERSLYAEAFAKVGVEPNQKTIKKSRVLYTKNELVITNEEKNEYQKFDAAKPTVATLPYLLLRDSWRKELRDQFEMKPEVDPKLQKITSTAEDLEHFDKNDPIKVELDTKVSPYCKRCDSLLASDDMTADNKCKRCGGAVDQLTTGEFMTRLEKKSRETTKETSSEVVYVYGFDALPKDGTPLFGKIQLFKSQFRYPNCVAHSINIETDDGTITAMAEEVKTGIPDQDAAGKMNLDLTNFKQVTTK